MTTATQNTSGEAMEGRILGLIAGMGRLPFLVADSARKRGERVVAVGFRGYTMPELAGCVDKLHWTGLAQMGRMFRLLKNEGVRHAVMIGGVTKAGMYSPLKFIRHPPDLRALKFWYRKLTDKRDASILGALTEELSNEGIELRSCLEYLGEHVAQPGCMTRRVPSEREMADVRFGAAIARELARLDVGQSIVVKDGVVAAVEAVEGTDETIRRGGALARRGAVLVKFSRPEQDFRYDVPVIGTQTVATCRESGVGTIAVEAGRVLLVDKPATLHEADRHGVAIVGVELAVSPHGAT